MKKSKIVVTLGPASNDEKTIKELILNGVDVFRFNFSHGDHESHRENLKKVREISSQLGKPVAVLQDLSGPKIRLGEVKEPFYLHYGDKIKIVKDQITGTKEAVSLNYPEILDQLKEGDYIYIADGLIRLKVEETSKDGILAKTIVGGMVSSRKGVNFPNVKLNISAITEKDIKDIEFAVKEDIDIIALSFVKEANDVLKAKEIIKSFGGTQPLFAKIEKHEAIENIDEIIEAADGIMVARGDLGVEIEIEKVPILQKMIIKKCNKAGKPVITATQMLTSMLSSVRPTRAEVSDIANAILDGTDAVMLSDETAVGKYPIKAVEVMRKTIIEAEKIYDYYKDYDDIKKDKSTAIAASACELAKNIGAKAIAAFTKSGRTAKNVARFRPEAPILAITHDIQTLRRLNIVWGVIPYMTIEDEVDAEKLLCRFVNKAYTEKFKENDKVIALVGFVGGITGSTSIIRLLEKEDVKFMLNNDCREG